MPYLKHELNCQLDSARTASPDEGIAFSHVTCGGSGQEALARTRVRIDPCVVAGGKEGGQEWICKIRVIDDVEEICTELHFQPFVDRRVLIEGEVPLLESRAEERIAAFGPVVLCSRDASAVREGTRNLEGGQVNNRIGKAGSGVGIADPVGTGKVLASAIVVAAEIEIQLEGLACL